MFEFNGFTAYNFGIGVPYVSITPNGMTFNKAVTMKLDYPEYVQLLINEGSKQIAILPCSESTQNAVAFYRPKQNGILSVRWNTKDLLNTIEYLMDWNLQNASYRVDGLIIHEPKAMIFDLKNAINLSETAKM